MATKFKSSHPWNPKLYVLMSRDPCYDVHFFNCLLLAATSAVVRHILSLWFSDWFPNHRFWDGSESIHWQDNAGRHCRNEWIPCAWDTTGGTVWLQGRHLHAWSDILGDGKSRVDAFRTYPICGGFIRHQLASVDSASFKGHIVRRCTRHVPCLFFACIIVLHLRTKVMIIT